MFQTTHNECVGFESKWQVKKVHTASSSQTSMETASTGTSTSTTVVQEAQTDPPPAQSDVDMDKLAEFMRTIYPKVKEQIDKSNNSRVFRGYKLSEDSVDATCNLVQELEVGKEEKGVPLVGCIDWNASGTLLGLSYSFKHKTWCYHTGNVEIYQFTRDHLTIKKRLSTENCITSLKFHPQNAVLLAAATFTGHIHLWNVDSDVDTLICNLSAHDDYITQISWTCHFDKVTLVSSSVEGRVKLWILDGTLLLKTVYKMRPPVLGQLTTAVEINKDLMGKDSLGVVSLDFNQFQQDVFVVGLEGGLVARCSTLGAIRVKSLKDELVFDPLYKFYEPHQGEILCVRFFLQRKHLFLASSTDGEMRVYSLLQDDACQIIFTKTLLNDLSFVLHEERLLACAGQNGCLEVYDLVKGRQVDVVFDVKVAKRALMSMAINGKKPGFVALGTASGGVQLWKVPWRNVVCGLEK